MGLGRSCGVPLGRVDHGSIGAGSATIAPWAVSIGKSHIILNSTRYEGWCQVTTRETSSTTTAPAASSQTGLSSPLLTALSRSRPMRGTECLDAKYCNNSAIL